MLTLFYRWANILDIAKGNSPKAYNLPKETNTMTKDYTKEQAIQYMKDNRTINTLCLKSLGIAFDTFLQFSQASENTQQRIITAMIQRA